MPGINSPKPQGNWRKNKEAVPSVKLDRQRSCKFIWFFHPTVSFPSPGGGTKDEVDDFPQAPSRLRLKAPPELAALLKSNQVLLCNRPRSNCNQANCCIWLHMKTLVLLSVLQCLIKCAGLASNCIRQSWLGVFLILELCERSERGRIGWNLKKTTNESKVKQAENTLIPWYAFIIVECNLQDELHRNPSNPRRKFGQVPIAPLLASWQIVTVVNQRQWSISPENRRFWVEHTMDVGAHAQTPPNKGTAQARTNKTHNICTPSGWVSVFPNFLAIFTKTGWKILTLKFPC